MKRLLTLSLMAFALIAGGLFTAKPASAAITCTPVQGTSSWPYNGYTQYCGGATGADGSNVATELYTILRSDQPSGSTQNEAGYILSNYKNVLGTGARFWVFGTYTDWTNAGAGYCDQNYKVFGLTSASQCTEIPDGFSGYTVETGTTSLVPQFTLIFKDQLPAGELVSSVAGHEVGHWLDLSSNYHTLLGVTSGAWASSGTEFQKELNQDWNNLNTKYQPCSTPSVFQGTKDVNGAWICNNNGAGPGLASPYSGSNENVLKEAWGYFYNPNYYGAIVGITGTATVNDILTITITDSTLSPNPQKATYKVPSSSTTLAQMASGLAASINGNSILTNDLITATSESNPAEVVITSRSRGFTMYSVSVSGAKTEHLTLGAAPNSANNSEFFAEQAEFKSGTSWGGQQSPDNFLGKFDCTGTLVYSLMVYGQVPGRTGSIMSWPTGQNCPAI